MTASRTRPAAPLAAWQRLDWRFLLPGPVQEPVVFLGDDLEHRDALAALGVDLRIVDSADQLRMLSGVAGTVVVTDPTPDVLQAAVAACRPGGCVHAEVRRHLGGRPRTLAGARAAFLRVGLDSVRADWHLRTIAHATRIVPLDSTRALRRLLATHEGSAAGRIRALLTRVLLSAGLVPYLAPEGSVTGRRPDTTAPQRATIIEGLALAAVGDRFQVGESVLITPREPTSRHVVAFLHRGDDSEPVAVVKVPRRPADVEGVQREADVLARLAHGTGARPPRVPAVLGLLQGQDVTAFVQTMVAGHPLSPGTVRDDPATAVELGAAFISRLPITRAAVDATGWYQRTVSEPLARLVAVAPLGGTTARTVDRLDAAVHRVRDRPMPSVLEHGDLAYPNLLVEGDRASGLGVIDWERATIEGVPGHDLVFFTQFVAEAQARVQYPRFDPRAVETAFDAAYGSSDGWAVPALRELLTRLDVEPDLWPELVTISWARSAATLAERLATDDDAVRPDVAVTVEAAREFVLWRHALDVLEGSRR